MPDRITVVIPAHDEEQHIGAALDAMQVAVARVAGQVETVVAVVANGCADRTAELAVARGATVLEMSAPNVGAARAAGFTWAVQHNAGHLDRSWLATTDADSRVGEGWLAAQVAAANEDADVYLGTIDLDAEEQPRFSKWLAGYTAAHETAERHGHVHGASMGMRAAWYLRAGGFRALEHSEDLDLVSRLVAGGARIAWDATCPVVTSSRLTARAPAGVARDLALSLQDWPGP